MKTRLRMHKRDTAPWPDPDRLNCLVWKSFPCVVERERVVRQGTHVQARTFCAEEAAHTAHGDETKSSVGPSPSGEAVRTAYLLPCWRASSMAAAVIALPIPRRRC